MKLTTLNITHSRLEIHDSSNIIYEGNHKYNAPIKSYVCVIPVYYSMYIMMTWWPDVTEGCSGNLSPMVRVGIISLVICYLYISVRSTGIMYLGTFASVKEEISGEVIIWQVKLCGKLLKWQCFFFYVKGWPQEGWWY